MAGKLESEVAKELDLSVIRYSRVWEDHRILSQALQIQPDDVVLSITSSGDNVLNLLLDKPKKIVAVDMSSMQNAILELKIAAITHLRYKDFLTLLGWGDKSSKQRIAVYQELKAHLPSHMQELWDSCSHVLENGLCNSGRLENYVSVYHSEHLVKVVSNEQIDKFFTAQSLEEQKTEFQQLPLDKMEELHSWYTGKEQQKRAARSEAQLKYVKLSEENFGAHYWRRFCHVCQAVPVQDNFYLSWWLRGERGFDPQTNPAFAPPYLTENGFTELKKLVDRVEVYTGTLEAYLNQPNLPPANKANLSDMFEYMDDEASDAMFTSLADHMVSGGRIALWNMLVPRVPPPRLQAKMATLDQLGAELHWKDRLFYYSAFRVIEIK